MVKVNDEFNNLRVDLLNFWPFDFDIKIIEIGYGSKKNFSLQSKRIKILKFIRKLTKKQHISYVITQQMGELLQESKPTSKIMDHQYKVSETNLGRLEGRNSRLNANIQMWGFKLIEL